MRSYTIDAENEEEFIKEYDRTRKSRLSRLNFDNSKDDNDDNERISEVDEEEGLSPKKLNRKSFHLNADDDEFAGLGVMDNDDEDEDDLLGPECDDEDIIKESEDNLIKKEKNEEQGIEMLCYYLKNSVMNKSKDLSNNELIFNKNKNIRTMSNNAIYDLNIRDLVDNILAENDNEYTKSNEGNNNSLRDYILQNIQSDCTLKIMFMSNNKSTKKSFVDKFLGINNDKICKIDKDEKDEAFDDPFEIKKKQIKLFNKNITLQIFDTSDDFHKNPISSTYYKTVSAFFILIESTNHNTKKYLDFIMEKISKYSISKTIVIFGINMLFEEDCTIDGDNLREYSSEKDMLFIPMTINNFDLKNTIMTNLLNLILIKGIDHKINMNSMRKGSKEKKLGGFKNNLTNKINSSSCKKNVYDITKMNIPSTLGYKKKYRIKHINAFDIDDTFDKKIKRKLSVDI